MKDYLLLFVPLLSFFSLVFTTARGAKKFQSNEIQRKEWNKLNVVLPYVREDDGGYAHKIMQTGCTVGDNATMTLTIAITPVALRTWRTRSIPILQKWNIALEKVSSIWTALSARDLLLLLVCWRCLCVALVPMRNHCARRLFWEFSTKILSIDNNENFKLNLMNILTIWKRNKKEIKQTYWCEILTKLF